MNAVSISKVATEKANYTSGEYGTSFESIWSIADAIVALQKAIESLDSRVASLEKKKKK